MGVSDVADVARIERLSSPAPWEDDLFRGCLRPDYLCRVMEQGAGVVGFAIANHAAGEGHLLNLAVHPDWRGRGCGRRLLWTVLRLLARRRVTSVFLEVRRSNERAIALYERFGFAVIGMRQDYYARGNGREDALTMRREIDGAEWTASGGAPVDSWLEQEM